MMNSAPLPPVSYGKSVDLHVVVTDHHAIPKNVTRHIDAVDCRLAQHVDQFCAVVEDLLVNDIRMVAEGAEQQHVSRFWTTFEFLEEKVSQPFVPETFDERRPKGDVEVIRLGRGCSSRSRLGAGGKGGHNDRIGIHSQPRQVRFLISARV